MQWYIYVFQYQIKHPGTCDPHHAVNPWGLVLPGSLSANVTCVERWDVCCCNAPWHPRLNPVGPWPWCQFELQEENELILKPRPAYECISDIVWHFALRLVCPRLGEKNILKAPPALPIPIRLSLQLVFEGMGAAMLPFGRVAIGDSELKWSCGLDYTQGVEHLNSWKWWFPRIVLFPGNTSIEVVFLQLATGLLLGIWKCLACHVHWLSDSASAHIMTIEMTLERDSTLRENKQCWHLQYQFTRRLSFLYFYFAISAMSRRLLLTHHP